MGGGPYWRLRARCCPTVIQKTKVPHCRVVRNTGGTALRKSHTLQTAVTSGLILYFVNSKTHSFLYFDIFEIKMHPTLDDALQLKLAAFFLMIYEGKVLPRVICILERIKYLRKYLLNTYPEPDTGLSCFNA